MTRFSFHFRFESRFVFDVLDDEVVSGRQVAAKLLRCLEDLLAQMATNFIFLMRRKNVTGKFAAAFKGRRTFGTRKYRPSYVVASTGRTLTARVRSAGIVRALGVRRRQVFGRFRL